MAQEYTELKHNVEKEHCFPGGGKMFDPTAFQDLNDAVVHIETSVTRYPFVLYGTGILVEVPKLSATCLLTCEHIKINETSKIKFLYQRRKKPFVLSLKSSEKLINSDQWTYDFQLLSLSEENQNLIQSHDIYAVVLRKPTTLPKEGDVVKIIQHPKGQIKSHSEETISYIKGPYLGYNADTEAGSSGAAIISRDELIGLHQEANHTTQSNQGTLVSDIVDHIAESSLACPSSRCSTGTACYSGQLKDGKFSGEGKLFCTNCGFMEKGQFERGKLHGVGIRGSSQEQNAGCYDGTFYGGQFHGQGKYTFPSGAVYEGKWENGKPVGKCVITFADGRIREVEWETDEKTKEMKCVFANNGRVVECDWRGMITGPGKVIYLLVGGEYGRTVCVGNESYGRGKCTCTNGEVYEGEWLDGKSYGKGTHTWPIGAVYEGEWVDGKKHGQGTFTWPSGAVYEGELVDGEKHGQGTFTWPNGEVFEGEYQVSENHGIGKNTYPNGDTRTGTWKNGKRDGEFVFCRKGMHTKEYYADGVKIQKENTAVLRFCAIM